MEPAEFFSWISFDNGFSADWALGLTYGLVGTVGALIFVYFTFDEVLPGMGGTARLNELELRRAEKEAERDEILKQWKALGDNNAKHEQLRDIEAAYDRQLSVLGSQIGRLRTQRSVLGMPLYALLGGVLASAFANNLLQAVVIGFGWTGVVQAIGLRRRTDDVKEGSKAELDSVQDAYEKELEQMKTSAAAEREAEVAQLRAAILALSTTLSNTRSPQPSSNGSGAAENGSGGPIAGPQTDQDQRPAESPVFGVLRTLLESWPAATEARTPATRWNAREHPMKERSEE